MDIESEDDDEDGMIHENDFESDDSLPQAALVEEYSTSNPYSAVPMYLEPLNTDEIERIPSPEIPNSSEISHQPVRYPTDGQIFQVYQQTAETYDRPTYEGATNDRYEQSQPASVDDLGVSLCYKSVCIQESRAGGDINNSTQAGISDTNGAGPEFDQRKCSRCQQRNYRAVQEPCLHRVCENCCVIIFKPCYVCCQIVKNILAMDPTE